MGKQTKGDRREYTVMIVPHSGQNVLRLHLPIRVVKFTAAIVAAVFVFALGAVINFQQALHGAAQDKQELVQLREVNGEQVGRLEQLSKETVALEQDMQRLDALDREIRRMLNEGDAVQTSRAGLSRTGVYHYGVGGPEGVLSLDEIANDLQSLQRDVKIREESLVHLKEELSAKQLNQRITPSIWPISNGEVTSGFGWRSSPFTGVSDFHPGLDIATDYGTPIVATAEGDVVQSGWNGGYGKMVMLEHGNGIVTLYGHCSQLVVTAGQHVTKGQLIAYVGSTGASTGSHVHYEVRINGTPVSPYGYLQ